MLIRMRSWSSLLCLGLALGCSSSSGDDDDATGTAGGTAANPGASGTQASGGSQAGNGNSSGGSQAGSSSSSGGDGGRRGGGTAGGSSAGAAGKSGAGGMSSGGGMTGSAGSAGSSTNPNDPYGDARTRCVNRTNALRATKGLAPIPILTKAEPCVDGQAKADSESGKAHSAFNACLDQVKWKAAGQNECPGYGSVEDTLTKCLDMMWAEGPGGGHYDNMVGGSTHTACGIYTTPAGKVWLVQDFWTE
jgi:hypothetical protein